MSTRGINNHNGNHPSPQSSPHSASHQSHPAKKVPLSAEERRRLTRAIHFNPLDCLDASGALDLDKAHRALKDGAIEKLVIEETFHTDKQGNIIKDRKIDIQLVDKLRALKAL